MTIEPSFSLGTNSEPSRVPRIVAPMVIAATITSVDFGNRKPSRSTG